MDKSPQTRRPAVSKRFMLIIGIPLGIIMLLIGGPYVYKWIDSMRTFPLTSEFQYIGKLDFGCYVGFCDAQPSSDYYYGTDMNAEELAKYLSKGLQVKIADDTNSSGASTYREIIFSNQQRKVFKVELVIDGKDALVNRLQLNPTNKKNIISLSDKEYGVIKAQLER